MSDIVVESLCKLLPKRIQKLGELAYNLWWTWHPESQRLFERIDRVLWEQVYHNPVKFLRQAPRKALSAAAKDSRTLDMYDRIIRDFTAYTQGKDNGSGQTWYQKYDQAWPAKKGPVAYFSFEYGIHESLPMYSGGLGVLAGDHLKEASDMGLPLVGVGFLYVQGYFRQRLTEDGWQEANYDHLDFEQLPITPVHDAAGDPLVMCVEIPNRCVYFHLWKAQIGRIPLYLMDTDLPENAPQDRVITQRLYLPDPDTRINQEMVLGIGGVRALRELKITPAVWHMNEGHPAFSTLERVRELVQKGKTFEQAREAVRKNTVFTTHTPVPAGNDKFPQWQIDRHLSGFWDQLGISREQFMAIGDDEGAFGMTPLALRMSARANGVSELHGDVSRAMWQWMYPGKAVPIGHVTNGVHTQTWLARRMKRLFDEYLGAGWLSRVDDPATWQLLSEVPDEELWAIRKHLKRKLAAFMRDIPRLMKLINDPARPVQILYAGKAHPADEPGKRLIQELYRTVKNADTAGRLVFIEDYDMNVARFLVQGVDVWMNTPRRPYEASGTSGMKAAINGAPNFSVLDGWWREAWNGKNGWAIGEDKPYDDIEEQDRADCESLYNTLENEIIPLYYNVDEFGIPHEWIKWAKESIATVAPRFSTRRMLKQYVTEMYAPLAHA